jgi:hypothetical protein
LLVNIAKSCLLASFLLFISRRAWYIFIVGIAGRWNNEERQLRVILCIEL